MTVCNFHPDDDETRWWYHRLHRTKSLRDILMEGAICWAEASTALLARGRGPVHPSCTGVGRSGVELQTFGAPGAGISPERMLKFKEIRKTSSLNSTNRMDPVSPAS